MQSPPDLEDIYLLPLQNSFSHSTTWRTHVYKLNLRRSGQQPKMFHMKQYIEHLILIVIVWARWWWPETVAEILLVMSFHIVSAAHIEKQSTQKGTVKLYFIWNNSINMNWEYWHGDYNILRHILWRQFLCL